MAKWFQTEEDREKETRKNLTQAARKVEKVVWKLDDAIRDLEKKNQETWAEAKAALKAGDRNRAAFLIKTYQHGQLRLYQLEKKKWIFESYVEKIDMMKLDALVGSTLKSASGLMNLDVDAILDEGGALDDRLAEFGDLSREWDRLFTRETAGNFEVVPSADTLMQDLMRELQGPVRTAPATQTVPEQTMSPEEQKAQIDALNREVDKLRQ